MEQMSSGSNDRNFNEGMSAFKVCKTLQDETVHATNVVEEARKESARWE